MPNSQKSTRVCVVLLNWNGWQDTIECLATLLNSDYPNFLTVVVDNGSTDSSLEQIRAWCRESDSADRIALVEYSRLLVESGDLAEIDTLLYDMGLVRRVVLISLEENLGFSGGNNVGARYALATDADYVWFLNNDTTVSPHALAEMVKCLDSSPDFDAATSQIRFYERPDRIWNCGGFLRWFGARSYLYANAPSSTAPQTGMQPVTFVTGCSLMVRSATLRKYGLLSERFFFGEEDFEFSMRMSKLRRRLGCCHGSVIFHKVSSSFERASSSAWFGKTYVYYLNRFIDMRYHMSPLVWHCWRTIYIAYVGYLLSIRNGRPAHQVLEFLRRLWHESAELDGVDRITFQRIMEKK